MLAKQQPWPTNGGENEPKNNQKKKMCWQKQRILYAKKKWEKRWATMLKWRQSIRKPTGNKIKPTTNMFQTDWNLFDNAHKPAHTHTHSEPHRLCYFWGIRRNLSSRSHANLIYDFLYIIRLKTNRAQECRLYGRMSVRVCVCVRIFCARWCCSVVFHIVANGCLEKHTLYIPHMAYSRAYKHTPYIT